MSQTWYHIWCRSTWETEIGELFWMWGHPSLHSQFQVRLAYSKTLSLQKRQFWQSMVAQTYKLNIQETESGRFHKFKISLSNRVKPCLKKNFWEAIYISLHNQNVQISVVSWEVHICINSHKTIAAKYRKNLFPVGTKNFITPVITVDNDVNLATGLSWNLITNFRNLRSIFVCGLVSVLGFGFMVMVTESKSF